MELREKDGKDSINNYESDKYIKLKFTIFNDLTNQEINELESKLVDLKMREDELIYKMGEESGGYIYLVSSGLVKMHVPNNYDIRKIGSYEIVGIENVFTLHGNNIASA